MFLKYLVDENIVTKRSTAGGNYANFSSHHEEPIFAHLHTKLRLASIYPELYRILHPYLKGEAFDEVLIGLAVMLDNVMPTRMHVNMSNNFHRRGSHGYTMANGWVRAEHFIGLEISFDDKSDTDQYLVALYMAKGRAASILAAHQELFRQSAVTDIRNLKISRGRNE